MTQSKIMKNQIQYLQIVVTIVAHSSMCVRGQEKEYLNLR